MEKLLIITNEFKKAGVGRYIQKLIPQLKKDFQITIVSRDKLTKSEKSKWGISNSIQIKIPKYIDIWPIKELFFFLKGITFFKKNKFDVIFCNYSFFIPNKVKKNIRVIHVFHSLHKQFLFANTPKKFKFLIIKLIHLFLIPLDLHRIKNSDKIITVSKAGYNLIKNNKAIYIPNPIERKINYFSKKQKKELKILFVARKDPYKGIDFLKTIIKKTIIENPKDFPNINYQVVGINDLGISHKNLKILGELPFTGAENAFKKSDIFISLSYVENTPNTLLSALKYGLIPLSSDVGDCRYMLANTEEFIFNISNQKEFLLKLKNLIKNYDEEHTKIIKIIKHINSNYNTNTVIKKIKKILK
jgi:glycosyltransferase involved in cell wall biosynthesis